ncbi:5\'-AMP-activated protein kinase subunit gamma-1 (AMPK gamma-1 chain) (AMPKg) [Ectocarpus siliculosus]|uniref:5\'-AMP-activated protein kinase subunit gamma-1 (AMPK gamma-1 chain) (AMPKg) n=1 Tax=Ectocarpus siliculosus TaxID=2880 RepID=D7FN02_ECTSI|nr:5\'-AMP-activated protein kinase subunit gamma-1 (AMPK gamma-1 chain) (AMPKg) [Ectocarpus siliculosus]|eukprot:CBJ30066.1 5\'-AMP-activated protein kinase subunit gamma-1 (AMPK gamma-1 chain) (AMPKg) [Ectocarpus siliculosus]
MVCGPSVVVKSWSRTSHGGEDEMEDGDAIPAAPEDLMQMNEPQAAFLNGKEVTQKTGKERINDFLRNHACYDLLKHSGKAAPLWDSRERRFVGLMTVTDFIDILRHYRYVFFSASGSGVAVEQLASKSIKEVLSEPEGQRLAQADFVHVDAEVSLLQAASLFQNRHVKFLPIIVPGSATVLALISHVEILEFLVTMFREQQRLFDDPIAELRIGIFSDSVVTVQEHACLSEVLDLLELHRIGAVPIVDADGRVVGIYSRSDITFLATAADPGGVLENLDRKLSDILGQPGNEGLRDRLITCSPQDTLQTVFEKFADFRFKRIVVVDEEARCKGIISVSDLLAYFL